MAQTDVWWKCRMNHHDSAMGRILVKMLQIECPECNQLVWITSDTRFATYHSRESSTEDCPGSRTIIPVPPKISARRKSVSTTR
ncbi:hypothetical protein H4V99_002428 [Cryobacterium sp. CG_9.6]|nr:hypothetical protein [Cryobacterium sp. CG_9.6]